MPLKPSDKISTWISDFKKSDAPQFKGKSDKERRDMAIAAYLSAKKGAKNEDSNIDEISSNRLSDYMRKSAADAAKPGASARRQDKRIAGQSMADKKIRKKMGYSSTAKVAAGPNEDVSELAMKTDPKIPNLKSPRDKKYNRQKPLSTYKQAKKSGEIRKEQQVDEETNFEVNIEGLPMMFMSGMGPGEVKQKLRKIVKQPSMIQSVKRVTDADVKKNFRLKAQGRDEEEQVDEALKHTHAVIDGNGKVAGMSSDEKGAKDIARRHNGRVVKLKKPISSRKGDMMINRPFSEGNLDELSPATMNRYKKAAADDLHRSFNRGISVISKPKTKKDRAALDKRMDKRKVGLNRAARITGTHGQQDESK